MAKKLNAMEQKAGSSVLDELRKTAQGLMKNKLDGAKKVVVASDSNQGLESGLDKAKALLAQKSPMHADSVPGKLDMLHKMKEQGDPNPGDEEDDAEEYGESMFGHGEPDGDEGDDEDSHLDHGAIEAKIQKLMAMKAKMKK